MRVLSTCYALAVVPTFLACMPPGTQTIDKQKWPVITPHHHVYEFSDARTARVDFELKDDTGKVLYQLQCRSGSIDERDFVFSGDFECRLVPIYEPTTYSTLLTDDPKQSRDWQSRGRFLVPELLGTCGRHPDYGLRRQFRLRGMLLVLAISDVRTQASSDNATGGPFALASFRFTVDVNPEASATSSIAEPAVGTSPPPECGAGYRSQK
jgi:hypothetical protein